MSFKDFRQEKVSLYIVPSILREGLSLSDLGVNIKSPTEIKKKHEKEEAVKASSVQVKPKSKAIKVKPMAVSYGSEDEEAAKENKKLKRLHARSDKTRTKRVAAIQAKAKEMDKVRTTKDPEVRGTRDLKSDYISSVDREGFRIPLDTKEKREIAVDDFQTRYPGKLKKKAVKESILDFNKLAEGVKQRRAVARHVRKATGVKSGEEGLKNVKQTLGDHSRTAKRELASVVKSLMSTPVDYDQHVKELKDKARKTRVPKKYS